jgi:hypothetical protein
MSAYEIKYLEAKEKLSNTNYGRRCIHLAQDLELEANALKDTNADLAEKLFNASKKQFASVCDSDNDSENEDDGTKLFHERKYQVGQKRHRRWSIGRNEFSLLEMREWKRKISRMGIQDWRMNC